MKDLPTILIEDAQIALAVHNLSEEMQSCRIIGIWQGISLAHLAFDNASIRAGKKTKDFSKYRHVKEVFDDPSISKEDYPGIRRQFERDGRVSALREYIQKRFEGQEREEMIEGAFRFYLLLNLE